MSGQSCRPLPSRTRDPSDPATQGRAAYYAPPNPIADALGVDPDNLDQFAGTDQGIAVEKEFHGRSWDGVLTTSLPPKPQFPLKNIEVP